MASTRMILAAVLLPMLLGGCTVEIAPGVLVTFGAKPVASPSASKPSLPCDVGPIFTHDGDVITDATGKEIVTLNRSGQKVCSWGKPGGQK